MRYMNRAVPFALAASIWFFAIALISLMLTTEAVYRAHTRDLCFADVYCSKL